MSSTDPATIDLEPLAARVASRTGIPAGRVKRVIAATFAELAAASGDPGPAAEAAAAGSSPASPEAGSDPGVDPYRWLPLRRPQGRWP